MSHPWLTLGAALVADQVEIWLRAQPITGKES